MSPNELDSTLKRIPAIRQGCDLDMLLFFHRHPCALLTSEQLVSFLGYDRERIAMSLESLIDSGLLARSQSPAHAARLYTLELRGLPGGLLASLLRFAGTREGRRQVMIRLAPGSPRAPSSGVHGARLTRVA